VLGGDVVLFPQVLPELLHAIELCLAQIAEGRLGVWRVELIRHAACGFASDKTVTETIKMQLAEGQRIQYNFVKPHMALDGKTPAQANDIAVKGWKELLEKAVGKRHFNS
jgi:hypothetical protein